MNSKIWYSFQRGLSSDDDIGFYDIKDLDWAQKLEDNYDVISKEVDAFMTNNVEAIKPYFNKQLTSKTKSWRTFALKIWNWSIKKNQKACPKITDIVSQIPGAVSVSVSILHPNTEIKPHRGDTNAIYRAHLGLEVPAFLPDCGMRVGYEDKSWHEGKVFVFNDAAWHRAWNHTNKIRYVLIVDVMRSEFINRKYEVCSNVLSSLIIQSIVGKIKLLDKVPRVILAVPFFFIRIFVNLGLRIKSYF